MSKRSMSFSHVDNSHYPILLHWLKQKHVQAYFHGQGLQNTLDDLEKWIFNQNAFHEHWIAFLNHTPFGYLMTSYIEEGENRFKKWQIKKGKAITLDLLIGDLNFLGEGLAYPMIVHFLKDKFSHVEDIFIDPEAANEKAVHVYQKAGFEIKDTFIAPWHPVKHLLMHAKMDDIKI